MAAIAAAAAAVAEAVPNVANAGATTFFNEHVGKLNCGNCIEFVSENLEPVFKFARDTYDNTPECTQFIPKEKFYTAMNAMQGAFNTAATAAKEVAKKNPTAVKATAAVGATAAAVGGFKAFRRKQGEEQPPTDTATDVEDETAVTKPAKVDNVAGADNEENDEGSDEYSDEGGETNNTTDKTTDNTKNPVEVSAGKDKCCTWSCCKAA